MDTFTSTLCLHEGTYLADYFSGRHEQVVDEGRIFVDRPPDLFAMILEGLRTSRFVWPVDPIVHQRVTNELDFLGLLDKAPFLDQVSAAPKYWEKPNFE